MRVFKYLFFALLFLIIAFFVYGYFFLPDKVQVSRSITIDRPAKMVFKTVNSMHTFNAWSPWADIDPNATYEFTGPAKSVGSKMAWQGNDEVGSGRQTIIESTPNSLVKTELYFDGQGDDPAWATLQIKDLGDSSEIAWIFDADFNGNVLGRYFGLMMDDMLGPQYETGLNKLKALVEAQPVYDFSGFSIENVTPQNILYVPTSANTEVAGAVANALREAYGQITQFMQANGIDFAGMPMAITRSYAGSDWVFDAAIPVNIDSLEGETEGILLGQTYGGKAVKYIQKGPYDQGDASMVLINAYLAEHELETNGAQWDVYANDPTLVAESEIETHIYQPIK